MSVLLIIEQTDNNGIMLKSFSHIAIFIGVVKLVYVSASCSCPDNEVWDSCIKLCPPRRCDVNETLIRCATPPQPGDSNCVAGCRCADDLYRNDKGFCVPKNQCPIECGVNEIQTSCIQGICEARNCSDLGKPIRCVRIDTQFCTAGCLCKEGYLRNTNGTCVPIKQCPSTKVCGKNEIPTPCFEAICERRNCSDLGKPFSCVRLDPRFCTNGCLCKEGYLRNEKGFCVPIGQCPITNVCGKNEIPTSCIEAICERRNCSDIGKPIACVRLDPRFCTDGCLCKEGYLRNEANGVCVPIGQCPNIQCGPNEILDACPGPCPGEGCGVNPSLILCLPNPQPGDPDCNPGCRCRDNYFRNDYGFCVTRDECPKTPTVICGSDEVPTDCVNGGCGIRYCSQTQEICNLLLDEDCIPGCLCRDRFLRAENGTCIPADQCPPKCGLNEYFTCGGACDNVCATLKTQNQTNCPIVNKKCNSKCYCKEGYARDGNNICIPIKKCPLPVCGINQIFDICPAPCPSKNCDDLGKLIKCKAPPQPGDPECNPSCRCADNYYRNNQGVCVTKNECPLKCYGQNEVVGCQNSCSPQTCESIGKKYNCPLQSANAVCEPACVCKQDYFRDINGLCISKEDCPKRNITCGPDEEYDSCVNGGCDRRNCSQPREICINLIAGACREGCRCKEGMLRNDEGICIPANQCPINCLGQNEIRGCQIKCPPQTCESIGKNITCPPQTKECIQACRCKEGYFRNKLGECISKENCLKCTRRNELFSCGGACDNVCQTLAIQNQSNCPVVNIVCNKMCYCEKGYARDRNNACIPICKCPPPTCGQNEVAKEQRDCTSDCCPQPADQPSACPDPCSSPCKCRFNFLREPINGTCIRSSDCPAIPCGKNEQFKSCPSTSSPFCSEQCSQASPDGNRCSKVVGKIGIVVACRPGCVCADNYWRNANNECVPYDECSPTCGKNAVYDTCLKICPTQSCDFDPRVALCAPNPQPGDPQCKPGCRCIDNYFRNNLGQCVRKDQCDNNNNKSNGLKEFEQGNAGFTLRFLYEAAKAKPGVSLIISPFSILFLLAQLALYATGTLLEQLLRLLNLDSKPKIRSVIPNYLNTLSAQKNVTIDLAAKTYISELYELSSNFKTDTREIFYAEAQNLDFCKPNEAASIINAWVEQNTNNMIKNLVLPSSLNCDTVLVLVNAIYFKGDWLDPFNPKNTRKEDFYVDKDKTVQVNMMSRTGSYKYAEIKGLNAQVIELPYKSDNFSLMICLPMAKDGINNLLDGLSDSNFSLGDIRNDMESRNLKIKVPAFNISSTWDLKEYLMKKYNVPTLFARDSPGLQDILQSPKPIYVSSGTQKATVIVNESGSEAAAATAVIVSVTSVQLSIQLTADHPFIYFILYKGTPLFCGIYFADV